MIKSEIYTNGPMSTRMDVWMDFFSYKGGIYQHVYGAFHGAHAIKIVGWGKENGIDFWTCANSSGPEWGEKGFFRIKWGECGIDGTVFACTPDLSPFMS